MWRFFNPSADTDLNLTSLSDFVLDDQTALTGATINIGYVSITEDQSGGVPLYYSGHRHHPRLPPRLPAGQPFIRNREEGRSQPLHSSEVRGGEGALFAGGRITGSPLQDKLSHSDSHQWNAGKVKILKTRLILTIFFSVCFLHVFLVRLRFVQLNIVPGRYNLTSDLRLRDENV